MGRFQDKLHFLITGKKKEEGKKGGKEDKERKKSLAMLFSLLLVFCFALVCWNNVC